jgi:hypothetical protein
MRVHAAVATWAVAHRAPYRIFYLIGRTFIGHVLVENMRINGTVTCCAACATQRNP